jgi:hypothetical protein
LKDSTPTKQYKRYLRTGTGIHVVNPRADILYSRRRPNWYKTGKKIKFREIASRDPELEFKEVFDGEDYYGGIFITTENAFFKQIIKETLDFAYSFNGRNLQPFKKIKCKLRPNLFSVFAVGANNGKIYVTVYYKELEW